MSLTGFWTAVRADHFRRDLNGGRYHSDSAGARNVFDTADPRTVSWTTAWSIIFKTIKTIITKSCVYLSFRNTQLFQFIDPRQKMRNVLKLMISNAVNMLFILNKK